ncbi:MAG: dethiobiotin synthase [Planctomycetota bacterium]
MTESRRHGLFVTGTDTGVGKTVVASGLVVLLREQGLDVGAMKPVETGVPGLHGRWPDSAGAMPADALMLASAMAWKIPLTDVLPQAFAEPLAPSVAAARSGTNVDVGAIIDAYRALEQRFAATIVEGAGGLAVPLSPQMDYADLCAQLGLSVLVVARPGLGTINHTVLTIRYARSRGLPVAGFVINRYPAEPGAAEETNPGVIADITGAPLLGILPEAGACPVTTPTEAADLCRGRLDLGSIAATCRWNA